MNNEIIGVPRATLQKWLDDIGPSRHVTQYASLKRDELRALLGKPAAQPQGEPVAWANGEQLLLCSRSPREVQPNNPMMHNLPRNIAGSALRTEYCDTPLYAAQPRGEHPA